VDPSVEDTDYDKADSASSTAQMKGSIDFGKTLDGAFGTSRYEGYAFQATQGSKVSLSLTGDVASTDTALLVYGPKGETGFSGSPIVRDDNGFAAGSRFSKLSGFEIPADGEYLVVAACKNTKFAGKAYHLALACDSGSCVGSKPSQGAAWTVLVYGSYDTHDSGGIPSSLPDMKQKVTVDNKDVNILFLEDLPGSGNTKLFKIGARSAQLIKDYGELHMGKPETLTSIIKSVRQQYPSRQFMLSLIGHTNSGVSAFLPDYTPPSSNWASERMMYWQVRKAVLDAGRVDVLALSGCGTGELEVVSRMADVASFVVGLQEYNTGYTDVRWADSLTRNPTITARSLSWRMAQGIFKNGYLIHGESGAVGAYDTSKLAAVKTAFKALNAAMNGALSTRADEFIRAKKATQSMLSGGFQVFIDAVDFADQVAATTTDADLKAKAKALSAALSAMIVGGGPGNYADEEKHPRAHGINLVFMIPGVAETRFVDPSDFDELSAWPVAETSYYEETGWRNLVTALYPKL
jgi:hypothetical protein